MDETTKLPFDQVLMDGIQDMVIVVRVDKDSTFYFDFLNRVAMERMGLTQKVIGKSIRDVISEEQANSFEQQYIKVVTSHESVSYENSHESPLGEKYYSKTILTPLFDKSKECSHIVAIVQDITEKKWADFEIKEYWHKINESKQRYRSLYDYNSDAIFSINLNGHIIGGNTAVESVTGYLIKDLIGSDFTSLVIPDDINLTISNLRQALRGESVSYKMTILNKTAERIEVIMKYTPIIINKVVVGIYGIIKDVTEKVNLVKKYKESELRFRIIAENSKDLITLLDEKGKIIYVSPSFKNELGFGHEEYIGKFFFHNIHEEDKYQFEKTILESIRNGQSCNSQIRKKHRTKGWIWYESNGTPVFDDENQFMHMVCVSRDIHLQKEYETKLKHFAYHDSLSNLPNRRLFKERLTEELNELKVNNIDGLAVMIMDIDHFKSINDRMGHDIGDVVITEFGNRVSKSIRENDIVARLGGDEFVILLPKIGSPENAAAIAEKIHRAMQEPWSLEGYVLNVTSSIGIAIASLKGETVSSILKKADEALYEAKGAGRNTYKLAHSDS